MAEDMSGKTDDLSSNDWPADYSGISLLDLPIKKAARLGWVIDDEIMESCLSAYGCLGGQSAGL